MRRLRAERPRRGAQPARYGAGRSIHLNSSGARMHRASVMELAMPQASFVVLPDRGVLAVSGPDCRGFLQGLVSNDVEKIAADRAVYAALLTAQGKYLHDFVMAASGEAIWLDAEAARLTDLKRRLSIYRLRAKVVIDELADRKSTRLNSSHVRSSY